MRSPSSALALLCAASLVLALAKPARAQDAAPEPPPSPAAAPPSPGGVSEAQKASARAHFKLGVDFYREGNFRAALIEFQRAYADSPHYKLLYNLGQASLELQEYASAIDFLAAYLSEGSDEIAPERRAEVEQTIRYLESRIAYVTVATNEPGAELYVDDTLIGRAPLAEPVRVGAGRHTFSAVRDGQPRVERRIDVAAGDRTELRLDFAAQPPAGAPLGSAPPAPVGAGYDEPGSGDYTAAIVMGAATGGLLLGAVTMTLVTGAAQQTYQEELLVTTTKDRIETLRSDAQTKALVTDILWGATAVSAVVTTILFATAGGGSSDGARAERGVSVRAGVGSLALTGQF